MDDVQGEKDLHLAPEHRQAKETSRPDAIITEYPGGEEIRKRMFHVIYMLLLARLTLNTNFARRRIHHQDGEPDAWFQRRLFISESFRRWRLRGSRPLGHSTKEVETDEIYQ